MSPWLAPLVDKVAPAVSNVSALEAAEIEQGPFYPFFHAPFFRRFFDMPGMPQQRQVSSR